MSPHEGLTVKVFVSIDVTVAVLRFKPAGYSEVDMPKMFAEDYHIIRGLPRSSSWNVVMPDPDVDLEVIVTRLIQGGYRVILDDQVKDVMHYNELLRSGWKRP